MIIKLQTNTSPKNALTKEVTDVTTLSTVTLKDQTDIIDPVFVVTSPTDANVLASNYITAEALGRSYFITDIKSVRAGVWEISAHVDVLSTYATEIKAQRGIIKRQANAWNLYLNDGIFKVYQNTKAVTAEFPTGFSTYQYVLAVAGQ